jgi:hypothetical protein
MLLRMLLFIWHRSSTLLRSGTAFSSLLHSMDLLYKNYRPMVGILRTWTSSSFTRVTFNATDLHFLESRFGPTWSRRYSIGRPVQCCIGSACPEASPKRRPKHLHACTSFSEGTDAMHWLLSFYNDSRTVPTSGYRF